jgi:disulfide bond formation protein DsbB
LVISHLPRLQPRPNRGKAAAMLRTKLRPLALLTTLGGALALAVALGSQYWGGLVPCALCLLERWPYRIVVLVGLIALMAPYRATRILLWLAVLTLLVGVALAGIHVGVEQRLWPSPLPECAAPHISGATISQMLAAMPARPSKPCDAPTYLVPGLPLSMAAMNLIYALGFAILLAAALLKRRGICS